MAKRHGSARIVRIWAGPRQQSLGNFGAASRKQSMATSELANSRMPQNHTRNDDPPMCAPDLCAASPIVIRRAGLNLPGRVASNCSTAFRWRCALCHQWPPQCRWHTQTQTETQRHTSKLLGMSVLCQSMGVKHAHLMSWAGATEHGRPQALGFVAQRC